mgnify:CR=1 FL=1
MTTLFNSKVYRVVENPHQEDAGIELTGGEWDGLVYQYGKVHMEDGKPHLNFERTLRRLPNGVENTEEAYATLENDFKVFCDEQIQKPPTFHQIFVDNNEEAKRFHQVFEEQQRTNFDANPFSLAAGYGDTMDPPGGDANSLGIMKFNFPNKIDNSFIRAIFKSLCVFSMILAASATFIVVAL